MYDIYVWEIDLFRIPDLEAEQTESLIGIDSGDHEA